MNGSILAKIPLFGDLAAEQCEELAQLLQQKHVPAAQPLFWIGDEGTDFYIITEGHVRLTCPDEGGREMILADLGPGHFFGELSLLDGGRRTATARTSRDTHLLYLDRDAFQRFLLRHPTTMLQVIAVLAKRQREMVEKLRGIANANDVFQEQTTTWSRIADVIARVSASRGFVLTHAVCVVTWVTCNLALGERGWDPYPFMFLAMWASLEAIFLSMFVLISQNRQTEKDRIQADLEYQVNVKAQAEVMQLHRKIDELREMMQSSQSVAAKSLSAV